MTFLSVRPGMDNIPNGKSKVVRNFSELGF
jgi:hypothetical protein